MFSAPRFQMSPPENAERGRAPCLSPPRLGRPEGGALASRRLAAALAKSVTPWLGSGPRFLELPGADGRTLPGASAASSSQTGQTRRPIGSLAARKRSVSLRPRAPLPLRRQEHPHDGVPRIFSERDGIFVLETGTNVKISLYYRDENRGGDRKI